MVSSPNSEIRELNLSDADIFSVSKNMGIFISIFKVFLAGHHQNHSKDMLGRPLIEPLALSDSGENSACISDYQCRTS